MAAAADAGADWTRTSWRSFPIVQQPKYADQAALRQAAQKLRDLPPIVGRSEVDGLLSYLGEVAHGKRFLLQGGDCAERFTDCNEKHISEQMRILVQMSLVLVYSTNTPTVRVGRIAGQYAKPRSKDTEVVEGFGVVSSFRGDNVNGYEPADRTPDPQRLVQGYFHSAATRNYMNVAVREGLADLRNAKDWDMGFVKNVTRRMAYQEMATRIVSSLEFLDTCGMNVPDVLRSVDLFTSHEGLHLEYEEAMTSEAPAARGGGHYNLGAHFLWIGDRTRQLDHAHVEYFRGIVNPVGVKVGPTTKAPELVSLIRTLNPSNKAGKVTLITRFGVGNVKAMLPPIIEAVRDAGLVVVWCCDPMHGNTFSSEETGLKTRSFDAVLGEVKGCFEAHTALGSRLGGCHFELTGDNVTECTGGPENLAEKDLPLRYTTYCDPRLNYAQSLEIAFLLAEHMKRNRAAADAAEAAGDGPAAAKRARQ